MMEYKDAKWHNFESIESLRHRVCNEIVETSTQAIAKRGRFSIVLAGGNTPRAIYRLLRDLRLDWSKWFIYHSDERCLSKNDVDRNSLMVEQAWLQYVNIPRNQVYDIPAELGAIEGAKVYAEILKNESTFDLVLLGLGEDGHTASLFPGHGIDNSADAVAVFDSPKPPAERITISQKRLSDAREVFFLVVGEGKQDAVNNWRKGAKIPASLIKAENGVDIFCYDVNLN